MTLALADRLDTLVSIFVIGLQPSGSKDPFAIRRTCLGLLNIILENDIDIDLREAINFAGSLVSGPSESDHARELALTYTLERFVAIYKEKHIAVENFKAVAALGLANPLDINRRVLAISEFKQLGDAGALISANRRVMNILSRATFEEMVVNSKMLLEPAEINLFKNLKEKGSIAQKLIAQKNYPTALMELASLRQPIDEFFEKVLVMAKESHLRENRLALLWELSQVLRNVADFSLLTNAEED